MQALNEVLAPGAIGSVPGVSRGERAAEDSLVQLMNEYERTLFAFLLVLVRDAESARDCTQDTFLRAYEALRKGKDVTLPWLYTVARNRAIDEFRRKRRVRPGLDTLDRVPVFEPFDQRMAVRQVMEQLPALDRDVLYLFGVAGFKTEEIASRLGVRSSAVRQRMYRARERFRTLYGAEA